MQLTRLVQIVVFLVMSQVSITMQYPKLYSSYNKDNEFIDPELNDFANDDNRLSDVADNHNDKELFIPPSILDLARNSELLDDECEPIPPNELATDHPEHTTCYAVAGGGGGGGGIGEQQSVTEPQQPETQHAPPEQEMQPSQEGQSNSQHADSESTGKELRMLVQHLYIAQARVQLEATEIRKAQAVATSAQQQLEEASNHVRTISAALQNAQQEVAAAAIRAQIAQLQLAAHDQLLFAARQDVDALSSQMVGLQAAEGIVQPKMNVDVQALLEKLRQPLADYDKPTAVPAICPLPADFTQRPPHGGFDILD